MKKKIIISVIAIVVIFFTVFAVVAALNHNKTLAKARDSKRVTDLNSLKLILTIYYADNSCYPQQLESLVPDYLELLPADPLAGKTISSSKARELMNSDVYDYKYSLLENNRFILQAYMEEKKNVLRVESYE